MNPHDPKHPMLAFWSNVGYDSYHPEKDRSRLTTEDQEKFTALMRRSFLRPADREELARLWSKR